MKDSMMDSPRYEINIFYSAEDEGYVGLVPELQHCSAWGRTYEEALTEVRVAMDLHLDTLREEGRPIPEPRVSRAS
jgi:predicted RNase H-like HicB family nuclease